MQGLGLWVCWMPRKANSSGRHIATSRAPETEIRARPRALQCLPRFAFNFLYSYPYYIKERKRDTGPSSKVGQNNRQTSIYFVGASTSHGTQWGSGGQTAGGQRAETIIYFLVSCRSAFLNFLLPPGSYNKPE